MKHIRIRRMLCTALAVLTLAVSALPAASAASRSVRITHSGQVVDTLNGVPARYIPGTGNSNTGDYSCAGYVKAYYSKVYGAESTISSPDGRPSPPAAPRAADPGPTPAPRWPNCSLTLSITPTPMPTCVRSSATMPPP